MPPDRFATGPGPSWPHLHIDIGAQSRARRRESLVRVGDVASGTAAGRAAERTAALAERSTTALGAYIALEAARRIAEAKEAQVDVVAVAAVQEEIGLYGARAAAYGLDPHVAIAIDVTPATDYPGGDASAPAASSSAMGAMIARGPTVNKQVVRAARETPRRRRASRTRSRSTRADVDRRRRFT